MMRWLILLVLLPSIVFGFSKDGTTYTTDGSQADVEAAIADASPGDTIQIPSGTYTYGASGNKVEIDGKFIVQGAGIGSTTIQVSETWTSFAGVFEFSSGSTGAILKDLTILGATNSGKGMVQSSFGADGWRITNVKFDTTNGGGGTGNLLWMNSYGVVDNCTFDTVEGELIFTRGPTNSWQTADSLGTTNNVVVEDCTFDGTATYVCDANANSRFVIRFCRINTNAKVDGHGIESNTPAAGVRHMEVYSNRWTDTAGFWNAMELRGGSGMVFDNISENKGGSGSIVYPFMGLRQYGYYSSAYLDGYQTPNDYPIPDQIGVGQDPLVAGSAPFYFWSNILGPDPWPIWIQSLTEITGTTDDTGYSPGTSNITLTAQSSTIRAGDAVAFTGDTNRYLVAVTKGSGAGVLQINPPGLIEAIPASATSLTSGPEVQYQYEQGDAAATFVISDVVQADREYFTDGTNTFDGTSGVGVGTAAEMAAITPTTTGVGFWVTDEGEWWADNAGADGRLYVWDGDSWELEYTPLVYPHPLVTAEAPATWPTVPDSPPNRIWIGVP